MLDYYITLSCMIDLIEMAAMSQEAIRSFFSSELVCENLLNIPSSANKSKIRAVLIRKKISNDEVIIFIQRYKSPINFDIYPNP